MAHAGEGHNEAQEHAEGSPATSTPAGSGSAPVKVDSKHATEASGAQGGNPSTAGPGPTAVVSGTPENSQGHLNPSAPEDSNTTPGSTDTK